MFDENTDGISHDIQKPATQSSSSGIPPECPTMLETCLPRLFPPRHKENEQIQQELPSPSSEPQSVCEVKGEKSSRFFLNKYWNNLWNKRNLVKLENTNKNKTKCTEYLNCNRDFLEAYVFDNVPACEIQKWLSRKNLQEQVDKAALHSETHTESTEDMRSTKQVFMEFVKKLKEDLKEDLIILAMADFMCSSVGVDAYRVYKLSQPGEFTDNIECFTKNPINDLCPHLEIAEPDQTILLKKVIDMGTVLSFSRSKQHLLPETPIALFKSFGKENLIEANHILYQPILTENGKAVYIIEMWRINDEFNAKDKELSSNFVIWASLILRYCNLCQYKKREKRMLEFLLDVVKSIFEKMESKDQLFKRILEFVQKLVNADRASLFVIDSRNLELVSTVFDLKFEQGQTLKGNNIKIPIDRGIAGHVALSGKTMNVPDAYSDHRFNREIDDATGYKTKNILCMPLKVKNEVIGVVQMVNKINGEHFDDKDERAFESCATFFGLALYHAKLYDKIIRKEQKYRVALEVLSYHNRCSEKEVQTYLEDKEYATPECNNFYLDPYKLDDSKKCKAVINMFDDLFIKDQFKEKSVFNKNVLIRFILTVKKNYRNVPYHNFDHGWSVAQAMYVIIKHDKKEYFDYNTRLALFVACLCHDLDHRGYTNKFLTETESPLASMYTTSPLEHHHFNITVKILQEDGHNIFSHLTSDAYKDMLQTIKHCILATDLEQYFRNLKELKTKINDTEPEIPSIDLKDNSIRSLVMAISMTAADLSASAKPWNIQIKTVEVIFKEFYEEGDKQKANGKTPIPMMDKSKPEEKPISQVQFLDVVCIPCYRMLHTLLPETKPMLDMAIENRNKWQKEIKKVKNAEQGMERIKCPDKVVEDVTELDLNNDQTKCFDDDIEQKEETDLKSGWDSIKSETVSLEDDQNPLGTLQTLDTVENSSEDEEAVITK